MTPLLSIRGLTLEFQRSSHPPHRVLRGLNLTLHSGEVLGLVGESGSGKSITASAVLALLPPGGRITAGTIHHQQADLLQLKPEELRRLRGRSIALVPQSALGVLNPCLRIDVQMNEILTTHLGIGAREAERSSMAMLEATGLSDARRVMRLYPHELSGGMRQRVTIAMALACKPDLVLADEPTTALDAVIRRQVLETLVQQTRKRAAALLLITHDLAQARQVCDRIAVMYAGQVVEDAPTATVFLDPRHHYTRGLLNAGIPIGRSNELAPEIPGFPPGLHDLISGCAFASRCGGATDLCRANEPGTTQEANRTFRCFHPIR